MRNLAPDIQRQRLLVEGFYTIKVDETVIEAYFEKITGALGLRMYGKPIIFSPVVLAGKKTRGMMLSPH